mmetsp:Transcript_1787/g.4161  ORF Transcript_1787/g.4161 Transcript_1787/m.4161 type:complete len:352 (+) Transcript_1787:106-1161(+)
MLVAQEQNSEDRHTGRGVPFQNGTRALDFFKVKNPPYPADEHGGLGRAVTDTLSEVFHRQYRKKVSNAPQQSAGAAVGPHFSKMKGRQGLVGRSSAISVFVPQIQISKEPQREGYDGGSNGKTGQVGQSLVVRGGKLHRYHHAAAPESRDDEGCQYSQYSLLYLDASPTKRHPFHIVVVVAKLILISVVLYCCVCHHGTRLVGSQCIRFFRLFGLFHIHGRILRRRLKGLIGRQKVQILGSYRLIIGPVSIAGSRRCRMGDRRGRIIGHARQPTQHTGDGGTGLEARVNVLVKEKNPPGKAHQHNKGRANTDANGQTGRLDGINRRHTSRNPKDCRDDTPGSKGDLFSSYQ